MEATKHCRSAASIFDVSHMLGSSIRGKDAIAFTERIVVGDIKALKNGTGTLSVVTNENEESDVDYDDIRSSGENARGSW